MKQALKSLFMVGLLLGVMACQINFPAPDDDPLPTIPLETMASTEPATVTLPPTEFPTVAPTITATNFPPTLTIDPVLDASQLMLESRTHTEENSTLPGYRLSSTYPVFTAPIDERLTNFNLEVEEIIVNMEASFRTDANAIPNDPNFGPNQSILDIQYQVMYFERGVISIYFNISLYMSGAAHPNGFSVVLNYDLVEGARINMVDLFLSGSNYLTALSDYCTTNLASQGRLEFPAGALPDEVNYKSWNITPTGLRITFDPYQVGPYAMGFQVVDVPYADLSSILRLDGALGRVMAP